MQFTKIFCIVLMLHFAMWRKLSTLHTTLLLSIYVYNLSSIIYKQISLYYKYRYSYFKCSQLWLYDYNSLWKILRTSFKKCYALKSEDNRYLIEWLMYYTVLLVFQSYNVGLITMVTNWSNEYTYFCSLIVPIHYQILFWW